MINASFVFGLDSDGPSVFKDTLEWIVRNRIETVTSHILTPYPGTALYERMKVEGRLTDDNLSNYDTAHVVFKPKCMTAQELYDGYLWIYREVYSLNNILRRTPNPPRSCALLSLQPFLPQVRTLHRAPRRPHRIRPCRCLGASLELLAMSDSDVHAN